MSTQCGIAIKTEKGYETIYCHHDGYPEYMWPMLTGNYNSEELAKKLISMGDASYIAENIETNLPHSFDRPRYDTCCFYHRDRGEDYSKTLYPTKQELLDTYYYAYIWEDGRWKGYADYIQIRGFEEEQIMTLEQMKKEIYYYIGENVPDEEAEDILGLVEELPGTPLNEIISEYYSC